MSNMILLFNSIGLFPHFGKVTGSNFFTKFPDKLHKPYLVSQLLLSPCFALYLVIFCVLSVYRLLFFYILFPLLLLFFFFICVISGL